MYFLLQCSMNTLPCTIKVNPASDYCIIFTLTKNLLNRQRILICKWLFSLDRFAHRSAYNLTRMLLHYEKQIFSDLMENDGLLIMAK